MCSRKNNGVSILNSMPNETMLNPEICANKIGQIQLIFSTDFRSNHAYALEQSKNEFGSPEDFATIEFTFGSNREEVNGLQVYNGKLGNLDLVCVRSLIVLE